MTTICDEFEAYGYRRVGAELRHRGMVVNSKKVRRLMRGHCGPPYSVTLAGATNLLINPALRLFAGHR